MKHSHTKWCRIRNAILVLLVALTLSSCDKQDGEALLLEKSAARVGDREITLRELYSQYQLYLDSFRAAGVALPANQGEIKNALNTVLDELIREAVVVYQAELQGYADFSPAEEAQFQSIYEQNKQKIIDYYTAEAESIREMAPEMVVEDYVEAAIGSAAIKSGLYVKSIDEFWNTFQTKTREEFALEQMKAAYREKINPEEAEIRAVYDRIVSENQARLKDGPGEYKSMEELYVKYGGTPVYVIPEGYIRIRHIVTTTRDEAELALARLESGEDFASVAQALSEDQDFLNYPYYQEYGKLLSSTHSRIDWSDAVKTAAFELSEPGSYSPIIEDAEGFHIVERMTSEKARVVPYEDAIGECREIAREELFKKAWGEQVEIWSSDAKHVKIFEKNITKMQIENFN